MSFRKDMKKLNWLALKYSILNLDMGWFVYSFIDAIYPDSFPFSLLERILCIISIFMDEEHAKYIKELIDMERKHDRRRAQGLLH